jgi:hypothetical protein
MSESKIQTLDSQLFTWEDWDSEGPMSMQFSNVELKVPVGEFPAGTKFSHAFLLGEASVLVLVDEQGEEHGFHLNLSVGSPVAPDELQCQNEGCTHHH